MQQIFGQYIPRKSFVHKLDPRTKIIFSIFLMLSVFFSTYFLLLFSIFLFLFFILIISRISPKFFLLNLQKFYFFLLVIILFPAFYYSGHILFEIFEIPVFKGGLLIGLLRAFQFVILILIAALFNATTSSIEIADGLRFFLLPFGRIRARQIAITFSITLRFVPIFQEEANRILAAQKARGAFLENNLLKRSKQMLSLIVPLFESLFRKADNLALALDLRGFNAQAERTHYIDCKFEKYEYLIIFSSMLILILILLMR